MYFGVNETAVEARMRLLLRSVDRVDEDIAELAGTLPRSSDDAPLVQALRELELAQADLRSTKNRLVVARHNLRAREEDLHAKPEHEAIWG